MKILQFLLILLTIYSHTQAQNLNLDSLKTELSKSTDTKEKIKILDGIVTFYTNANPDSLLFYNKKFNEIAGEVDDYKIQMKVTNAFATFHFRKGNFDSSIYYHELSRDIVEESGEEGGTYFILANIGAIYLQKGNYEKALNFFLESSKEADKRDAPTDKDPNLSNIAIVYYYLKNYKKSLEYNFRALQLRLEKKDNGRIIGSYINIGALYNDMQHQDSAMYYFNKSMSLSKETPNNPYLTNIQYIISSIYLEQENYDSAQWYMEESLLIEKKTNNKYGIAERYMGLSDIQNKMGNYSKSLNRASKAQKIFEELGAKDELAKCLYVISLNHNKLRNYKKAFTALEKSKVLKDSIHSKRSTDALSEMQVKYETEKKEKEILLQKAKLNEQSFEINQEQTFRNIAIGGALIISLLALLLYRNFKLKSKSNEIISNKNLQLDKSLKERESLLKEIHHRVKNNLQVIASLLYLQSEKSDNKDIKKVLEEGQGRVKSMALIHQKLYENDDLKSIPFKEYLEELVSEIQFSFGDLAKDVRLEIDAEEIYFDIDTAIPLGLIVNELSTNAFKYAYSSQKSPVFKISIQKNDQREYFLKVIDNGEGLPDEYLNTNKKTSLGLKLTRMLSNQLEGEYQFNNTNGTSFELKFAV